MLLAGAALLGTGMTGRGGARAASTTPPDTVVKAASTLFVSAQLGGLIRDWCVAQAPAQQAAVEQGYAAWRATFGLPAIEAYLRRSSPELVTRLTEAAQARQDEVNAQLAAESRNPAADCANLRDLLMTHADLAQQYPQDYAQTAQIRQGTVTAAPTPAPTGTATAGTGGPFVTGTEFGPFYRSAILTRLVAAGGQAPFRPGGTLKSAAYTCLQKDTDENETLEGTTRYTLTLWADHGLRATNLKRQWKANAPSVLKDLAGRFTYDANTGAIQIDADYDNRMLEDLVVEVGVYRGVGDDAPRYNMFRALTGADGRMLLYGQQTYGADSDTTQTICTPAGAPAGLSPVEAARREQAEQERIFNLYRTTPGAGATPAQIEGIIHSYDNRYDGINVTGEERSVLLLRDGRAYLNLRWTPHDLNVAASVKGEPQQWTRWRRSGAAVQVQRGGQWEALKGVPGLPFQKNERLTGTYGHESAYTSGTLMWGATSVWRQYYTFTPDGRFTRSASQNLYGNMDDGFTRTTGSAASSNPDEEGTYRVSGYTLELRYRSGRVDRTCGFFWDAKRSRLVIGGTTYSRK